MQSTWNELTDGGIGDLYREYRGWRELLKRALAELRWSYERGWNAFGTWTDAEHREFKWLVYCNPELNSLAEMSEQNVIYFCRKYKTSCAMFQRDAERHWMGLDRKPKLKLGPQLFGKKRTLRK